MTTRWGRFARGQVAAIFSTFVAAFSHGVAGGSHPPLFAIALALAFSGVVCVFLAGVRLSRIRLAASVIFSQLLYHGLFSLFGGTGTPTGTVTAHHHGAISFSPVASGGFVTATTDQWMLLAHAAAAVLTFAVLLHGERLCIGLGTLARVAFAVLVGRMPWSSSPVPLRLSAPTGHRPAVPHRLAIVVSSLRHRGPPVGLRFA